MPQYHNTTIPQCFSFNNKLVAIKQLDNSPRFFHVQFNHSYSQQDCELYKLLAIQQLTNSNLQIVCEYILNNSELFHYCTVAP